MEESKNIEPKTEEEQSVDNFNGIYLTNKRIHIKYDEKQSSTNFPLDQIQYIENKIFEYKIFQLLSGMSLLGSITGFFKEYFKAKEYDRSGDYAPFIFLLFLAGILYAIYHFTRRKTLTIGVVGKTISTNVLPSDYEKINTFILLIFKTREKFISSMNK
jgi:hypothetical protein